MLQVPLSQRQKQYAVWLLPEPGERRQQLEDLIQTLAGQYGLAPFLPHVELTQSGVRGLHPELQAQERMRAELESLAASFLEPPELTLRSVEIQSNSARDLVYVTIEQNSTLEALRRSARDSFRKPRARLTPSCLRLVSSTFDPPDLRRIIKEARTCLSLPMEDLAFTQIVLCERPDSRSRWRPLQRSPLRP